MSGPFHPRAVLAMLAVGTAAFLLFLYALGQGWTGAAESDGRAHAAANGLNGFAALAQLLERRGYQVTLSRNAARLGHPGLVVITPQPAAGVEDEGEDVRQALLARRYIGPTLVILPKWSAMQVRAQADVPDGWVHLMKAHGTEWVGTLPSFSSTRTELVERAPWQGYGLAGRLPHSKQTVALAGGDYETLVSDAQGRTLAALARMGEEQWPILLVAEPDLMNNYGLSNEQRARVALALVDEAMAGEDLPVVFDLTLAGLGASENLLTLAFKPPFLAATLCLLLGGLFVAWRAFRRFGPAVAEDPATAFGKRQLARNAAGLIERSRRVHLLGPPYAASLAERIAGRLGVRESHPEARELATHKILELRGIASDFPARLDALRRARSSRELLRAAGALKSIERILAP